MGFEQLANPAEIVLGRRLNQPAGQNELCPTRRAVGARDDELGVCEAHLSGGRTLRVVLSQGFDGGGFTSSNRAE